MTERPILYSAPMVCSVLDGIKFNTRRVCKPAQAASLSYVVRGAHGFFGDEEGDVAFKCPYGDVGDRLWVRENGWERPDVSARQLREGADTWPKYEYDAKPLMCWADGELKGYGWKRRPSIHMPRWASRITLEITGVRVERLQDISETDALAEGIRLTVDPATQQVLVRMSGKFPPAIYARAHGPVIAEFASLWETINGAGSWAANPLVWVVSFKVIKP